MRGLSPSQAELVSRVEAAGGLDIDEVSGQIGEVRDLIAAGLLCLEATSFLWGICLRVVPACSGVPGPMNRRGR